MHRPGRRGRRAGYPGDLIRELAAYEKLTDQVTATEADIARALFEQPAARRGGGRPPGWRAGRIRPLLSITSRRSSADPGLYLEDLYVRPPFRGRGFGRRLLVHLARIAVDRGCGRFEWSVLDWNAPAIAAYRRVPAPCPMDEWTVYRLTGDALKRLAEEER